MLNRYWLRKIDILGAASLLAARPLDTGSLGLAVAAAYSTMEPGEALRVDALAVAGVYADAGEREHDTGRSAAEVGALFSQSNDDTLWTLAAVNAGGIPTWTAHAAAPPVLASGSTVRIVAVSPTTPATPSDGYDIGAGARQTWTLSDTNTGGGTFHAWGIVGTPGAGDHGLTVTAPAAGELHIAGDLPALPYEAGLFTWDLSNNNTADAGALFTVSG